MPIGFDSDIPDKSERGGAGAGGGFSGGGGGGGVSALGGGGGGFGGFQPLGFGSQGMPGMNQKRRYYASGNGSAFSTSPGGYAFGGPVAKPSDTIPAKLTPGEFVVNRTAASDPRNAQQLEQMNQQGLQEGGYDDAYAPHEMMEAQSPGLSREALVELLGVLLSGQQEGYGLGGWVGKHKGLLMGLGALAAPFVLPALAGAAGVGGAAAGAGGATAAGSGAGMATMLGSPVAGMTNVAQGGGLLARANQFVAAHPTLMKMGAGAYKAKGQMDDQRAQSRAMEEQDSDESLRGYAEARQRSEQGYAFGGMVRPSAGQSRWGNMNQSFAAAPAAGGGAPAVGNGAWMQHYTAPDPSVLSGMQEAGSADANAYASGVFRQAQLEGADPGAQAAYRLRALAGASRGAADRLSAYRTDFAAKDLDYRRGIDKANADRAFEFQKQANDVINQERLKRVH